ncbi:septum-associated rare lipoprotein A [Agrobacterium phage OLIVR5]|uniref:Septum-associated rare lipoprotein A n=1 Tax=Agrobacterium phage OLIVR5 TaxID=2723773 RepID=A0A858MSR8_9CAUD|nr:septum-associated rare lipoprotein A [Agrobacterium phage OLIVR5]QIW87782.1 septum-associated rare lipoprotein A [Agrobacterium phage OLIVR5]QIW88046.1 septum-associated rare lipoprotein A [Agrobacterium phage OLIVR6]
MQTLMKILFVIVVASLGTQTVAFGKDKSAVGIASYYGKIFEGRKTASGEKYSGNLLTAAHMRYPMGSKVKVTDLKTGKSVIVRINDRGPHIKGRIVDLSNRAARELGILQKGVAKVSVQRIN